MVLAKEQPVNVITDRYGYHISDCTYILYTIHNVYYIINILCTIHEYTIILYTIHNVYYIINILFTTHNVYYNTVYYT